MKMRSRHRDHPLSVSCGQRRTALLTGTTSGIGLALSHEFARAGFALVLVSRDLEKLRRQKSEFEVLYQIPIHVVAKDLAQEHSAAEVHETVQNLGLSVSILVNNAGFNVRGTFAETTPDAQAHMIQLHIVTLAQLTRQFLPSMIHDGWGRILNLGSTGSFAPCPCSAVYAATKAFVLSFSQALSSELQGTGVSVTCLCPGATRTEFARKADLQNTLLFRYGVMSSPRVARLGFRGCMRGSTVVIPGIYNKMMVRMSALSPASVVTRLSKVLLAGPS